MEKILVKLLDKIEKSEYDTLAWGDIYGSLSVKKVEQWADELIDENDENGGGDFDEDLLEILIQRSLVFEIQGERIRSRFAETVRLLVQLRQWFRNEPWHSAKPLVSDFRVDLRKRIYPARDQPSNEIRSRNPSIIPQTPLRKALWIALTENPVMQLARFQEASILRLLTKIPDSGTIITAGTGSGKTLAYYLPVLLSVGELIKKAQYWVKAISIYPRNELLKDQLSEAFKRSRFLDETLDNNGNRPILIGALFGSTPIDAGNLLNSTKYNRPTWPKKDSSSFICPWFSCPKCDADLIWGKEDIEQGQEILRCESDNCYTIGPDHLIFTRKSLVKTPPDILFTTTEMLNQRMSDIQLRKLFGLGQKKEHKPQFMLLDEVHTYTGINGAQVALLLRRWKHLLNSSVTWCGLSATLEDAPRFFAELVGLKPDGVEEITPTEKELVYEGAEYQIVLRGDQTLDTSILSTSIQSTFLMSRMLDPLAKEDSISKGLFGKRTFFFTDNLDVTNRMRDDLRDAEGYDPFGNPERSTLASLRGREPDDGERNIEGQRWNACEDIGHSLKEDKRLNIGRTSSQDIGVDNEADVVVATASLEVGYDDEDVGAVIQHKAPRSNAQYIQRKGRAGRIRGMRPFMLTILSDYGRDRIIFQSYENLFDPSLKPQSLPIKNDYVLRIQAVYSTIDWLLLTLKTDFNYGSLWEILSGPLVGPKITEVKKKIKKEIEITLEELVSKNSKTISSLTGHLQNSLHLSKDKIFEILWKPPRSILQEVVPTLLRRILTEWKLAFPDKRSKIDYFLNHHPLPEFVPRTLWGELNLPEVEIEIPPARNNENSKIENLPILQAIKEHAPGRVTRRFAPQRGHLSHWIRVEMTEGEQKMRIDEYTQKSEMIGQFSAILEDGNEITLPVYRPWKFVLSVAQRNAVLPTSNSFPIWFSQLLPIGDSFSIKHHPKSSWFKYASDVNFHMHSFRSSVAVRRFSHKSEAFLRQKGGDDISKLIRYVDAEGKDAAIGFEMEVDGFYVDFDLPKKEVLESLNLSSNIKADTHLAYHRQKWLNDVDLPPDMGDFERDWIHQILLSAAIVKAIEDDLTLRQAADMVLNDAEESFTQVMKSLFGHNPNPDDRRLEAKIFARIEETLVLERLRKLVEEFENPDPEFYSKWLRETLHGTLAEALLQACINVASPQASTDTVISDFIPSDENGRVWITETTVGGAGVIQAFANTFSEEPRSLFRSLEATLAPSDIELSCSGLRQFISLACEDEEVKNLISDLRSNNDHKKRIDLLSELYRTLKIKGIDVSRSLKVSINTRFLKPGMDPKWDSFLGDLLTQWDEIEEKLSIAVGLREFSFVAIKLPEVRNNLNELLRNDQHSDSYLIKTISALLWPRGSEMRERVFDSYNPYRKKKSIDPELVRNILLTPDLPRVDFGEADWGEKLKQSLAEFGTTQIVSKRVEETSLRKALIKIMSQPVDVKFLQFFPIIERVERADSYTKITLTLREQV